MKKVAVIGSGFAGLTSAIELASLGYQVTVFEKNSSLGGRARKFEANGFTFDMGPSWYWMPDVFDKFFERHGKKVEEYYNLLKLDPGFSVVYGKDNTINVPASFEELVALFEDIEKGSGSRLKKFLKKAAVKYNIGMDSLVYKPSHSIFEFINLKVLIGVLYLDVFSNFRSYVKKYFSDSRLTRLMEFPVLFLGATPQNTPALYSLMNYSAFSQGTYYPMGGFHEIIIGLSKLAKEKGVIINCDSNVDKLNVVNGKVEDIVVNGEKLLFDGVIASADYHHVEQKLLEKFPGRKPDSNEIDWAKKRREYLKKAAMLGKGWRKTRLSGGQGNEEPDTPQDNGEKWSHQTDAMNWFLDENLESDEWFEHEEIAEFHGLRYEDCDQQSSWCDG